MVVAACVELAAEGRVLICCSVTFAGGGGAVVSPGFDLGASSDGSDLCAKSDTCAHAWIDVWWGFGIGIVVQECVE